MTTRRKQEWTNAVSYEKDEYLTREAFEHAKSGVRRCWREVGMLHLRMENDMNTRARKTIPAPEIARRLRETAARMEEVAAFVERPENKMQK